MSTVTAGQVRRIAKDARRRRVVRRFRDQVWAETIYFMALAADWGQG